MQEAPQTTPQPQTGPPAGMKPARGGTVLTLGILGIVICFILGIIAWVMGNGDLREIKEGKRDPSGEQLTKAGMICGIVGTILGVIGFIWWLIAVVIIGSSGFLGALGGF
jgi:preprotein translocase subunit Sss1